MRVQHGEEEAEAADVGVEGPCEAPEEAQVGEGSLGLHAKLHYVVLVVVYPVGNRRLFVQMGWAGLGQELEGKTWMTMKEREVC